MDINYLRAISREMHDEMVQRQKTFKNLIASEKMTRDEANHRYVCLRDAKRIIDAHAKGGDIVVETVAQIRCDTPNPNSVVQIENTLAQIGEELLVEIAFRKKVYGYKVFQGYMTKFEMERKLAYFQFAHTLIAPPIAVKAEAIIQPTLF